MTTPYLGALIGYTPRRIETMTQEELAPIASCLDKFDATLRPIMEEAERRANLGERDGADVSALANIFGVLSDLLEDLRVQSALSRRDELLTEDDDRQAAEDQRREYHASLGVKTGPQ